MTILRQLLKFWNYKERLFSIYVCLFNGQIFVSSLCVYVWLSYDSESFKVP